MADAERTPGAASGASRGSPSAPAIEAPKGGGAIRGIGEKFTASPQTGTGSMSVPIALSAGRSGFGPQLSLTYDSGAGNGPFGIGWHVSLPSITRKTDKGIPRYGDSHHGGSPHGDDDIFILSGAEDLVAVGDATTRDGYSVQAYRPRIDTLFARIERWVAFAGGAEHWRSISKDNILTVYGLDASSRVADPDDPGRVFSWLICQSYDDRGNAIAYDYLAENSDAVDLSEPGERHRTRGATRYPHRIRYGNATPLLLDASVDSFRQPQVPVPDLDATQWLFEAVFDYGQGHYQAQAPEEDGRVLVTADLTPSGVWPVRADPFSVYRAGFEVRTYRLCRRILMFHHFAVELGTADYLVSSTGLTYQERPTGSQLTQVVTCGYRRQPDGRFLERSRPPLDLEYSPSPFDDPAYRDFEMHDVDARSARNLPTGWDERGHRWIDLDGDGIAGVLTEQAGAWFYKPNLGAGRFGEMRMVATRPAAAAAARHQLLDLAGTGQPDLVDFDALAAGFHPRTDTAGWDRFRSFGAWPTVDWTDPRVRIADVTGDGLPDVLITEDECLVWHASLGYRGFGPAVPVRVPRDEERGPSVAFADSTQSIYLADLSGDGLSDIVRIRNGDICYWPNLGYGRFGAKVTMAGAPWFDRPDLFDQSRIRLADTDGTGPADLIYLGRDCVRVYLNECGNGWSAAHLVPQFPIGDDQSHVSVVDLLGRGTSCLCWSSPLPAQARRPIRYVDLMAGRKPRLLTSARNNLGAETLVTYTASTEFSLADAAAGTPWITRLPFPVHVVSRVDTYDRVGRSRFVSRYAYHHGFFDPIEREFRGFGRVDQWDTEEFGALRANGAFPAGDNIDAASHVPPVLTKTWYHTGVFASGSAVSRHLAAEYYRADGLTDEEFAATLLDDTVMPDGLSAEQSRQACRSLRGSMLRREVYAIDGRPEAARPYSVSEHNYTIRMPYRGALDGGFAVFVVHPREVLDQTLDRKLYPSGSDPRTSHTLTLDVDDYGNILLAANVGYGRRFDDPDPRLAVADRLEQKRTLLTYTRRSVTNAILAADAWRVPQPAETRRYELVNLTSTAARFSFTDLIAGIAAADDGAHDLPFSDYTATGATGTGGYQRLTGHERVLYRGDDLSTALGLGVAQPLALPYQTHRLALAADFATQTYGALTALELDAAMTGEGGFVHSLGDTGWWVRDRQIFYSTPVSDTPAQELAQATAHFFRERRYADAFGHSGTVDYDAYDLLTLSTRDPLGNTTTAGERDPNGVVTANGNDYRVLQPAVVTDANGNRTRIAFDALGEVVGTAVMGKVGEALGDSLTGFEPDLADAVIGAHITDPLADASSILGQATTRVLYDLFAFARTQAQPAASVTFARETHSSVSSTSRVHHGISYSDGFGREIQKKSPAEAGPVTGGGPIVTPRWLATGWTIFDNKGNTVRKYEPFFNTAPAFTFGNAVGVSPIVCYDPLGRAAAVVHPNHSWEKAAYDPWRQDVWDVTDTVDIADPATDADVGATLGRLPATDYLPTWYAARQSGALGAAEQDAATKAAAHAGTPAASFMDALGRTFLTVAHNRTPGATATDPPVDEFYRTRFTFDIDGNQREVYDAADRLIMRYDTDLLGRRIRLASMDAGIRVTLGDIDGLPIRRWDGRGHVFTTTYDALRRPVHKVVRGTDPQHSDPRTLNLDIVYEKIDYGESQPSAAALNMLTRTAATYDGVGADRVDGYDFKGNPVGVTRQLVVDFTRVADWTGSPALELETFANATTFDALNRPVTLTTPDTSVIVPTYNETGLLGALAVTLPGHTTSTHFVTSIDYNAKGDRTRIVFGNGAVTDYAYDPLTFRLTGVTTTRPATGNGTASAIFADPGTVQDLRHTYDPSGNITTIADTALKTAFYNGEQVTPAGAYTYDAIYRLIEAHGREHIDQSATASTPDGNYRDFPFAGAHQLGDLQAVRNYIERYRYDSSGNLTSMVHQATNGGWTRAFAYSETSALVPAQKSNALTASAAETYSYDPHGSITSMPHLSMMEWDFLGRLLSTARQVVNDAQPERSYHAYSAGGQRIRTVTVRGDGSRRAERLYLRGWERYREFAGETVSMTRAALHVMDADRRVALVDTTSTGGGTVVTIRYQFSNHLGSATLELDDVAALISYEEFTPYGNSAYQGGRSAAEVSLKRYRYTGKERDEETGFGYHGARYYAPWLGRWISCDPTGLKDGPNLYQYARGNPCRLIDPSGTQSQEARVPDTAPANTVTTIEPAGTTTGLGDQASPDPTADPSASPAADPATSPATSDQTTPDPQTTPPDQAPASDRAQTPSATNTPATAPAATTERGWLDRVSGIGKDGHPHPRTTGSWVAFGIFVALALTIVAFTARWKGSDPTWLHALQIGGIVVAVGVFAYLGYKDFLNSKGGQQAEDLDRHPVDRWSIVHTLAGVVLGLFQVPFPVVAALTVGWEVFESTVPGFGDQEINANRVMDITVAWGGWLVFSGIVGLGSHQPIPWGAGHDWTDHRLLGLL